MGQTLYFGFCFAGAVGGQSSIGFHRIEKIPRLRTKRVGNGFTDNQRHGFLVFVTSKPH